MEVLAGYAGDLGGRREVHDGFRALLWSQGKALADANSETHESAALVAEASGHKAGMQAIGRHACTLKPPRKFARKEDVAQLRAPVHFEAGPSVSH